MTKLLLLAYEFAKIGLFSIGGGLATLPFLYDLSQRSNWFSLQDVTDMIAISQSTPGPIGVNMATYVGFTSFGLTGAWLAPLALVAPSVVIIILISRLLDRFRQSKLIQAIFYGLRPASSGLILAAGISVAKLTFLDQSWLPQWQPILLALVCLALLRKTKCHPILLMLLAGIVGVLLKL